MMKVLYFMNHVDHGGAALALYDLIVEINKISNVKCVVITSKKNNLNKLFNELGIENYSFKFNNFMSSYHKPKKLVKFLLRMRYDINNPNALAQIEKTLDISSFDIIHTNLNRIDIGAELAKKYKVPHIWHIREHGEQDFKLMSVINNPVEYMNSFNSYFIAISKSVRKVWINRGLDPRKMSLIYDGVRPELYQNNYRKKKSSNLRIIFLGGYSESKGQIEAIKAISLLDKKYQHHIIVDMYGKGKKDYILSLKKIIHQNNLGGVVNLNDYDPEVYKKLSRYDIGLNCSKAEGFGRVTVEYMMAELCPIVSDTGANTEIVDNARTGYVYRKGDINQLKDIIINCINNMDNVYSIGLNARNTAINQFSMKKHAENILKLYNQILKNTGKTNDNYR